MSKYECRLVLNNFSKLLYKLYNAQNFFCAGWRPGGRLWWMHQHTVVSAAPACGVHVPIRSHVQALW
ncbi:BZ3501_MvSof-1269-A2-R1_Chr12-1g03375 [Microbotryum saponariae]|nr:BZ3501_MvSof-1269-A2-R1_Chr12-1g03375 [Microbotryum saponariae]